MAFGGRFRRDKSVGETVDKCGFLWVTEACHKDSILTLPNRLI